MKVALIGVGQAGGKVTERLARFDADMGFDAVQGALAVNSAEPDLQSLEFVDTQLIGADRVNGHGVGGDNELGAEIMQSDAQQVLSGLDGRITSKSEAIFVVAGLGGGTGSGGAPVLVHELQRVYDVPVYALGVLPGRNEGALYQANAGRSLKTLAREADATLLIDNDAWHEQGESVEGAFETINGKIAQRVGLLFASGEAVEGVGESVVDSSEVINTLRSGGIATLGYASEVASDDSAQNVRTVMTVARQALLTGTSLPDATTADSALLVIAGEPDTIPRKGVEKARRWLEDETESMQVRGGDFPLDSDRLGALVLLGGAERSSRIEEFMERAREAKRAAEGERTDPAEELTDDRLENLF
ncbi:cell division protein [Halobiforma lacisalsi AJ5]|uniref:Tubulin-like protein CetZ n=2 Tax=Natronobacterium TaxID=2256 RepID=M0L1G6_NATLA|nr:MULTISPECIES: tubulin/FtsZ family protein [Halobiforma]APW96327.1 cell division protein [Halobiforma lacisalsi AJ5]EMA27402.1 Tubulin/FtsZ GTPase [Halobiforma lacisalsi AJ5]SFB72807.1 Cell division GTPase FtsZ [Halobiforma haloterrestris]